MPSPLRLDVAQVRTIRLASQGMANVPGMPVAAVVARSGFVRTLGGCDAYLAIRARQRTLHRAELDAAVDRNELQVVPAARGCIYLVPRADAPLCLRVAEQLTSARVERNQQKAGIAPGETERVAELAEAALYEHGALATDALRKALPAGAVRSLGDKGKRVGVSSPLPGALRRLEFGGHIERTPEGGRLDTERYQWRVTKRSPFADAKLPSEPALLHALLLQRYAAHAGAFTLTEFCTWSGLPQRDAKAALPHAALTPASVDGDERPWFTTEAAAECLRLQNAVASAAAFLPFEDNLTHLYGGPGHLVDASLHDVVVPSWGRDRPVRLGDAPHLSLRGLIADGQLSGFWEFDPDAKVAVPRCFRTPSKTAQTLIEELSASTSAFLRDEIGHGHSFSLDTDDELRKRLALLQTIGGKKTVSRPVRATKSKALPAKTLPTKSLTAKPPRRPPGKAPTLPKSRPVAKKSARRR